MAPQIRQDRRPIPRIPRERYAWNGVTRPQARRTLHVLQILYRRAGR